jgi:hypothetical protein
VFVALIQIAELLYDLPINILMGCIHSSQTLPKHDQKGEKAERPGIIWRLKRRFRRKTEVVTQKEPFMVFTDTAVDNIIPHRDLPLQYNQGSWGNDALQLQGKLDPQERDTPQENLVPSHLDVVQDDGTSQQTGEEVCGDLNHGQVDFSQDIVIDSLCEAGPLEHYIVNDYLNEIDSQLNQQTREEAYGENDREDDCVQKAASDNTGLLDHSFIDANVKGVLPSHSDDSPTNFLSKYSCTDSLCDAGRQKHYIVNACLNEIRPQLSQRTGEEANGDFNGREEDACVQKTASDLVTEAGLRVHSFVDANVKGLLPSLSDESPTNYSCTDSLCDAARQEPATDRQCDASIAKDYLKDDMPSSSNGNNHKRPKSSMRQSNKLRPILKKYESAVPGTKPEKSVTFSASTKYAKISYPGNEASGKWSIFITTEIPRCRCVGCRTRSEEPELSQCSTSPSKWFKLKKPRYKLALPSLSRVIRTARSKFRSDHAISDTGQKEGSTACEKSDSKVMYKSNL